MNIYLLYIAVVSLVHGGVLELKEDRVLHGRPLSDKTRDGDSDYEYDHEAFLGDEDAEYFESLDPEESQRRLGIICDKIDTNGDRMINLEELQKWIQFVQEREVREDTERQWEERNKGEGEYVKWDDFKKDVYGFVDENAEGSYNFKPMLERDYRRWQKADSDGDDQLTKLEFQSFLHPEDSEHMRDIMVMETLEDMDLDKDGSISLDEYIGDIYKGELGDAEPDWVTQERTLFAVDRDKDRDGVMSFEEVKQWIIPDDFDHSLGEAKHLIVKADMNGDSLLSKQEVLDQYDMFVGSSATQFGEVLSRHDEF